MIREVFSATANNMIILTTLLNSIINELRKLVNDPALTKEALY